MMVERVWASSPSECLANTDEEKTGHRDSRRLPGLKPTRQELRQNAKSRHDMVVTASAQGTHAQALSVSSLMKRAQGYIWQRIGRKRCVGREISANLMQ
jgi:hypothetical protein